MNRLGMLAQTHWQANLPAAYAQIKNPARFFAQLGADAQLAIETIEDRLMEQQGDRPGEDFPSRAGRARMARKQAEEWVMREMILSDPEDLADLSGTGPPTAEPEDEFLTAVGEFADAREELMNQLASARKTRPQPPTVSPPTTSPNLSSTSSRPSPIPVSASGQRG